MPITSNLIMASGSGSDSTLNLARQAAGQKIIYGIFSSIHKILSENFTRIDENTVSFDVSTAYRYRESYKLEENNKKYLVVQVSPSVNLGTGGTSDDISIAFYITNNIEPTSTTNISGTILYNQIITVRATSTYTTSTVDNVTIYYSDIGFSCYMLNVKNESLSLYNISSGTNKAEMINSCGKCTINDTDYVAYTTGGTSSKALTLADSEGVIRYTSSIIIAAHTGTDDTDFILTLPVYLSSGNTAVSLIYKDLKLENVLQCPNASCSYGGVYKIGGFDYFALGNNFLVKI